jgi:type IV pilus biogenesis protein CpaD/CtpE
MTAMTYGPQLIALLLGCAASGCVDAEPMDVDVRHVLSLVSKGGADKDIGVEMATHLSTPERRELLVFVANGTEEQMDAARLVVTLLVSMGDDELGRAVREELEKSSPGEYRSRLEIIVSTVEAWQRRKGGKR